MLSLLNAPRLRALYHSQKILVRSSTTSAPPPTDFDASSSPSSSSSSSQTSTCDVVQGPNLLRTSATRPSPSLMLLPGLRSLPFWTSPDYTRVAYGDKTVSHVIEHLQKNADVIRAEYLEQQNRETNKLPPTNDYHDHQKSLHEGKWEWFSYLNKGNVQGNFAFQFPKTAKVLHALREDHLLFEGTPFGFCFFSNLHGNSSIQAHTSPMNLRLRIHLPLIVPETDQDEDCAIRVGNMARPWIQNKAMVLDDSYNHEVWNRTSQERVLLLVDIWHPDISLVEKKEIVGMFQQARQDGLWKR